MADVLKVTVSSTILGIRILAPFGICPDTCNTRHGTPIGNARDGSAARSCTRCDLGDFTGLQDVAFLEAQSRQATVGEDGDAVVGAVVLHPECCRFAR